MSTAEIIIGIFICVWITNIFHAERLHRIMMDFNRNEAAKRDSERVAILTAKEAYRKGFQKGISAGAKS